MKYLKHIHEMKKDMSDLSDADWDNIESSLIKGGYEKEYKEIASKYYQDEINKINSTLFNDKTWRDYYCKIDRYDLKRHERGFLQGVLQFGKNRLVELQAENEKLYSTLTQIILDIEDSCPEIINDVEHRLINKIDFDSQFKMNLKKDVFEGGDYYRGHLGAYNFSDNEILDLWPKIISTISRINELNLVAGVNCAPNLTQIIFRVQKLINK